MAPGGQLLLSTLGSASGAGSAALRVGRQRYRGGARLATHPVVPTTSLSGHRGGLLAAHRRPAVVGDAGPTHAPAAVAHPRVQMPRARPPHRAWLRLRADPATRSQSATKRYGLRQDLTSAPWAAAIGHAWGHILGDAPTTPLLLNALSTRLSANTYGNYSAAFRKFAGFCQQHRTDPLTATPVTVCHYLGWLAQQGTVTLKQNLYTSAINTVYRDLGLEPPARGPLVAAVRAGLFHMQVDNKPDPQQVALRAEVIVALGDEAEKLCEQLLAAPPSAPPDATSLYTLRAILFVVVSFCTISRPTAIVCLPASTGCLVDTSADPCLVINRWYVKTTQTMGVEVEGRRGLSFPSSSPFHLALGRALHCFALMRARLLPTARWFFQLPQDAYAAKPEDNGHLAAAWFAQALAAVPAFAPPAGTVWVPRSCRSGGASAATAAGAPRTSVEYFGGWVPGSATVSAHYIDPAVRCSKAVVAVFGFLSPAFACL